MCPSGFFSRWRQYFFRILTIPSLVNGLASISFIPGALSVHCPVLMRPGCEVLTPVEICLHILCANIRRHCNDRYTSVHRANEDSCRDAVAFWHDNIHEDQIKVFWVAVHLVTSLFSILLYEWEVLSQQMLKGDRQTTSKSDLLHTQRYSPQWKETWSRSLSKSYRPRLKEHSAFENPKCLRPRPWAWIRHEQRLVRSRGD